MLDYSVPPPCAGRNKVRKVLLADFEQVVWCLVPVIDGIGTLQFSFLFFCLATSGLFGCWHNVGNYVVLKGSRYFMWFAARNNDSGSTCDK